MKMLKCPCGANPTARASPHKAASPSSIPSNIRAWVQCDSCGKSSAGVIRRYADFDAAAAQWNETLANADLLTALEPFAKPNAQPTADDFSRAARAFEKG